MEKFYKKGGNNWEYCFYVETEEPLLESETGILSWLFAETFEPENISRVSFLDPKKGEIIEIGPRMNFETAFSTNAVSICRSCGLEKITRIERSRRYELPEKEKKEEFVRMNHDRMTECVYESPLETFEVGIKPEKVYEVKLLENGIGELQKINKEIGLGMDDWDINYYFDLFTKTFKRNPTNVECFQLGQANSEHSRHWFFKGKMIIDGKEMPENLLDIVRSTLKKNPANSLIAFQDNSSGIKGYEVETIFPEKGGENSSFAKKKQTYHPIFTAETHNFPSGVAPFPGAETGTGGRIRDVQATGKGALVIAGTAGYCTGNLNIPDYDISGESADFAYPPNLATPRKILVEESNGASDYGNKFGEPVIQGFVRTFGMKTPIGGRREWIKPIMFTGGVGQIDAKHLKKDDPEKGMLVVQIGGPAYRIGIGGGSASSMIQGENKEELDFSAVQRGDAELEQKMNRVVRTCVEMGENNPIASIHDQGAGGPCNVITEIVHPAGGKIEVRNINLGDKTLSVLEIWGGEYQERNALLVRRSAIESLNEICEREKINCEVLGEVTGDGKIVLHDAEDDSTPVNLELEKILGDMPQKKFEVERQPEMLRLFDPPKEFKIGDLLQKVFRLPSVGSKGYLVRKADRSVTGLIARQQCCGPLQLPVSDVAAVAQSHFGFTGTAISIGEQPIKMLVNSKAGARMAVGEALTNMVWARISGLSDIKCSLNWMWAAKLPGEGAAIYDAAEAMRDIMIDFGIAVDGGKDSLSMAAKVGDEIVKAPGQMVVSAYATMPDVTKIITPDIKCPGESRLMLIDLGNGKNRLGGSALLQIFSEIGDESPDADDARALKNAFLAIQRMIDEGLILSGHDRSDGGLITTVSEMAMSGNSGAKINIRGNENAIPELFSEELGLVVEYLPENEEKIQEMLKEYDLTGEIIGETAKGKKLSISQGEKKILDVDTKTLLSWWEATSDRLEEFQMNAKFAKEQASRHIRKGMNYEVPFEPEGTEQKLIEAEKKPKVAIIREEGSNGDREMTSAFFAAGFEPWDVMMTDLIGGKISLADFRGVVFVGGFSYADVLDSAKGWAGTIRFNKKIKDMFDAFYNRPDTFSLGICNGCQLMALLGWVPFKGTADEKQPRFIRNLSRRFESRWVTVKISESPAVMLRGMEGSTLGVWVAHGEGYLYFPDKKIEKELKEKKLAPISFVDDDGKPTESYPFNPNGSPKGFTSLCSPDGRHLAMMPHPERAFLKWQWAYLPEKLNKKWKASPWLKMFQNAREWCEKNK
ncbi:MAG: phosphoribosylformylglycinamidine synthase [Parcubacteria group bacterium]|jgi:phosphoribosylformylglycinamidine synthase